MLATTALVILLGAGGMLAFEPARDVLATFFIGQVAASDDSDVAGAREIAALRNDIARLREELQQATSR